MNVTAVAESSPLPEIVTVVPGGPDTGDKPDITGAATTVNAVAVVAVPPRVVTEIAPDVAPLGTTAAIDESVLLDITATTVPLNLILVAFAKPEPVMFTDEPIAPPTGENPVIMGAGTTVNEEALVAVPPAVVIEMTPVVAPTGTWATIWVAVSWLTTVAVTPLKVTLVAPANPVPVIVIDAPTGPPTG